MGILVVLLIPVHDNELATPFPFSSSNDDISKVGQPNNDALYKADDTDPIIIDFVL